MKTLFQTGAELLKNGTSFAYAVIISQDGSAPRGKGSRMLILPDSIVSTIGGGAMEGEVISIARNEVLNTGKPVIKQYCLSGKEAAVSDFICGGNCEILIFPVYGNDSSALSVFNAAAEAEATGSRAWLFYIISEDENTENPFNLCINIECKDVIGNFTLANEHFSRDMLANPVRVAVHGDSVDGVRYLVDEVHSGGAMYIFGGGHVSQQVAKMASGLGFRVTVIDDRAEYANSTRFPDCETIVLDDFTKLPDLPLTDNSYLLIITRGHAHDYTTLQWAMDKPHRYLGMIGSRTKRDLMYDKMEKEGISREALMKVCCPIGLPIGAETPEEIAVSIMAEIIKVKHGKN